MMRQRLLVACGLAAMLACADGGPDGGESSGFAPVQLVSAETDNGATPMFLTTPGGDRVLAWVSAPGGGSDGALNFAVTPAGAAGPLPTVSVRDSLGPVQAHGEAPPQLAADTAGRLYLLYSVGKVIPGRRFPVSALRFLRSDDGGRTWQAPVTVNDPGEHGDFGAHNFHALTVGPDGTLLATWLDSRTGTSGVWMSRSTDGGRSWEPNRPVYRDPACPCCRTSVAMAGDGTIYVAWRAVLEGDVRDIVVIRSADGGRTWDEPVRPRNDEWVYPGCPHAGPSLRVDPAGAVHIAWWTGKEGEAGVYYARSTDGGVTFDAQPLGVGERSKPAHVQLALADSGRMVVAWDDGIAEMPRVVVRRSGDGGRSFDAAQPVSLEGAAASFPVLGVYGDSVAVAWSQRTAEAHHEHLASETDMRDPKAVKGLPRVGQSEIYLRTGRL